MIITYLRIKDYEKRLKYIYIYICTYKTDLKTELSFLTQFGNFKFHVVYKDFRFALKKAIIWCFQSQL